LTPEIDGYFLRPTDDRVLVRIAPPVTETPGGILLPPPKSRMPGKGIVVARGPGRYLADGSRLPPDVRVGDIAYFRTTSGKDIQSGGAYFVMLKEEDVLMTVGEDDGL
jgi:chaperonin GroES